MVAAATEALWVGLNAPTGAWCSLTQMRQLEAALVESQCTYRCVVLPDENNYYPKGCYHEVSMHLQVRGAP